MISSGEELGIYSWMLFCAKQPKAVLPLVEKHPDSAFFLVCEPEDMNADFLDDAVGSYHLMPVVRYDADVADVCDALRQREMLYSVWYPYEQKDTETILNGGLFCSAQELSPVFTALLPEPACPEVIQRLVYQTVQRARNEQRYHTMLWELQGDNCLVDAIISDDACSVYFDEDGNVCDWGGRIVCAHHNLLESDLVDIFMDACPKTKKACKAV